MRAIILDIETVAALSAEVWSQMVDEIKAPSNYKDPAKIAAYVEVEKRKTIEKAALSPLSGQVSIVTIATECDNGGWTLQQFTAPNPDEDERRCLIDTFAYLAAADSGQRLVTFNGTRFDLPFLSVRAMVRAIVCQWPMPRTREYVRHLDLYQALGEHGSLDRYAMAILGRGKGGRNGKQASELWTQGPERQAEAAEYARDEMRLLIDLYMAWRDVHSVADIPQGMREEVA